MGLFDLFGTILTNNANSAQASRQMEFQASMSNTQHTREVQDLINAGLNPILSAGGSGASAPGGAMATMQNPLAGDPVGSAFELALKHKALKQADESIANTKADTAAKRAASVLTGNSARKAKIEADAAEYLGGDLKGGAEAARSAGQAAEAAGAFTDFSARMARGAKRLFKAGRAYLSTGKD